MSIKRQEEMDQDYIIKMSDRITENCRIARGEYAKFDVKRGLRNADGSGVLAGLSRISSVQGTENVDGKIHPIEGRLIYRGIDLQDITEGVQKDGRHGYAETVYLVLFGEFPQKRELREFEAYLYSQMLLPQGMLESNIMQFTSSTVMNQLQRVVLALYSVDPNPDDISIPNVVRQCLGLIARFPTIIAYAYCALAHKIHGKTLFIRQPRTDLDIAENFLHMLRPDGKYTPLEAELLDLALVLHAEHGGGNNSSFTMHVVTSSHSDTFSAMAASVGALKGPLHGAANANVMDMMGNIKQNVKDWKDKDEVSAYIEKILRKKAHNRSGLVYGIGHAVYTKSDPRAVILRQKARELAKAKGRLDELRLYETVAMVTPAIFRKVKNSDKIVSANVDFYSGFVYDMLGFPKEIYTPIFAMARTAGWSAHRIDELLNGGRLIRPAYKSIGRTRKYIPMNKR